jgi:hypothetical protein
MWDGVGRLVKINRQSLMRGTCKLWCMKQCGVTEETAVG